MATRRMTVDELADEVGISTRNIRYYQTRGLLPPPTVEGRTGYYGERHVERLQLIAELQAEGLNLQAIGWLLGGASSVESDEVRRLKRAVLDGWVSEPAADVATGDIEATFDGDDPARIGRRAVDLGLLEPTDDPGRMRVLLPTVLAAGQELASMGVDTDRALDLLALMRENVAPIAQAYVDVFDEAVLAPWDARGRPADEWPEVREAVERIRPLAGQALLAVFHQVMAAAVEDRLGETAVTE